MVAVLISLRATIARNRLTRSSAATVWVTLAFGLVAAAGSLTLGIWHGEDVQGVFDRISAVLFLWLGGQLAQAALNGGDASLRPELLAGLPIARRRLAAALLVVGAYDPALAIVGVAYAAVIAVAAGLGAAAILVALLAVAELLVVTSVATTVVGGALGPGSRRGRDRGTILVALAISVLALSGTVLPSVLSSLQAGNWQALAWAVRVLPSGWPGDAVLAAHRGQVPLLVGAMLAPIALSALLAARWPGVLARRMSLGSGRSRRQGGEATRRLLPPTRTGAVIAKEMRLWLRDPVRFTCLLIALIVGAGTGLVPRVTYGTSWLLPFAGPLTVTIAGACACNLYGNDGTSLWLTITSPHAAPPDVRGRQLAWLLIVCPIAALETILLTPLSGHGILWPWTLGLLLALVGGGAGLAPLASLISVQPLDEAGNPTPAWSLKVHVALLAIAVMAAPTAALLAVGTATGRPVLAWAGVGAAALTAVAYAVGLGAAAGRRLAARQVDVLRVLVAAS